MSGQEIVRAEHKNRVHSLLIRVLVWLAVIITMIVVTAVVGYILFKGLPNLKPSLFALEYNSTNVSMLPSIISTVCVVVLTLIIAVPLGVAAAIFLEEYTKRGNFFVRLIALASETLAGIPSIVYGLFGMIFFVTYLKWGLSLTSACFTLAMMVLPTIMRTTQEALIAVPDAYREGSYGLGAGRFYMVRTVVLPTAMPGIVSGIILAIGRIVGESAALIFTAGTVAKIPQGLNSSVRTMAVHMYVLSSEGLHINETYATAAVLLIVVILLNFVASVLARHLTAK